MNKRIAWILFAALLAALALAAVNMAPQPQAQVRSRLVGIEAVEGNYARADGPRELVFPQDHGPHDDFQTEWWYYTGNLVSEAGREFGFQLTFFRRAIIPPSERAARTSAWAADQVYLAHFTLTDVAANRFAYFERFERGAAGLAGALGSPAFQVWLQDWSVRQVGEDTYQLTASADGMRLDLSLTDMKGPVLQGERGYSQKGSEAGNASYYVSQTRLAATGAVQVDGERHEVSGWSWMDHEYSTSALEAGQVGWDWFSIQLDDNTEWMFYTIRRKDGSIDRFSKGTVIYPDGTTQALGVDDFSIEATHTWRSPHSGGEYPARWLVQIPSEGLALTITPKIPDQELNVSVIYWEGAVSVTGVRNGTEVRGSGYVELTGYAQSLENTF